MSFMLQLRQLGLLLRGEYLMKLLGRHGSIGHQLSRASFPIVSEIFAIVLAGSLPLTALLRLWRSVFMFANTAELAFAASMKMVFASACCAPVSDNTVAR